MLTVFAALSIAPAALFVSERGNDAWPGTSGRPFRTLARLQQAVLERRASGDTGPLAANLSGTFPLSETWTLGPEFSNVTVDGQGKTIFDGGVKLSEWKTARLNGKDVWVAETPEGIFRQLFVEGRRMPQARLPREGFYTLAGLVDGAEQGPWNVGQDTARMAPEQALRYRNLESVDFVAHHYWVQSRMGIREIERESGIVRFDRKSVFRLTDDYTGQAAPYRLFNVVEGLERPGDWVHDRAARRLYLLPEPGKTRDRFVAFLGRVPTLLKVESAKDLVVKGVTFLHTEWTPPADSAGDVQAAFGVPAAILLKDVERATLRDCQVSKAGTYAVEIDGKSSDNRILACDFQDLGGGGVKVGHGTARTSVIDCTVEQGGRLFAPAVGIWVGDSGANIIAHNRIRDLYYTGISVGWVWGYGPSQAIGNQIEANDISDLGQGELSDMGAIYTLGVSPGTVLAGNRIRNVIARGYGGWGIYLDEGSTNILVEHNLVENVKTGSFHQHYGKDNRIENNVFLNAQTAGQLIRSRVEEHRSFHIRNNVVVWKGTDLLGSDWSGDRYVIDENLYWRTDGKPVTFFGGKSLTEWQGLGHDRKSLIADPKMKIDARGVRFEKGSPALALGIQPIDLSKVGPRR